MTLSVLTKNRGYWYGYRIESEKVIECNFRRIRQVSHCQIKSISVQIDPQLLFQTLTLSANAAGNNENLFKYKLCSYPPAIYILLIDKAYRQSSALGNALWNVLAGDAQYTFDGGSLLQQIL